jgi:heat shock protein HslJ
MGTFFRVMVPLCIAALFSVCSAREAPNFASLLEKDWRLIEVRQGNDKVSLDRAAMEADGAGDAFTLRFDDERISGKAFPNRYFGPYSRKEGQTLTFGEVASTLMASIRELALTERDYFRYLEGVQSWNLVQGRLELYTVSPDGPQTVLVFTTD